MRFRRTTFIALFFALSISFSLAQSVQSNPQFVSIYGNFSISLPEKPKLTRGVRNEEAPDKGTGMIYAWETENIVYTALYLDPFEAAEKPAPAEKAARLEENNRGVREIVKKYQGRILSEKPFAFGALSGTEIYAGIGDGKMIVRNYQVERRSYSIQAVLRDAADEPKALGILASFRIIDGRALSVKKISENTPLPLPQTPVVKTPKTDVETANLKGKVKSILEEIEDLTGDGVQQGRIFSAEYFYDQKGFQTKEISYDSRGNPFQIAVFGFIDKDPVARFGTIRYPYNPPAPVAGVSKDPRYDLRFKYVYDERGRVTESKYYRDNGEFSSRMLTIYDEKMTEAQNFNAQNELLSKTIQIFDAEGNLSESVFQKFKPKPLESKIVYRYEAFDAQGNWTKRTISQAGTREGKPFFEPLRIYYRTFTYYDR